MSLSALKERLASVLDAPRPAERGLSTGIDALDRALAYGGIPRGRLTEVTGARGSGKTTVLRQVVETTLRAGGWVGYVDATRTLAPRDWGRLLARGGLWVARPVVARQGAWCADVLLRSGAFALVILDGAPPLSRAAAVRLTRLARQVNAALVVTGDHAPLTLLPGAVRLEVSRRATAFRTSRQVAITIAKGGGANGGGQHRTVEVVYAVNVARRLCAHPEIPDRRGVARIQAPSGSGRATPAPAGGDAHPPRVLPRKRRCAEPPVGVGQHPPPPPRRRARDRTRLETCC
ncbi:MAG TPA: ATPase domain-containing protein [Gemmatimonadaceae bacterium]|nr:ATPase domain-containing protein [Gemmatimonadaceae bacterium]